MEQLLTIKEAAQLLSVKEEKVRRYIRTGRLKAFKIGNLRVRPSDLDFFCSKTCTNARNKSVNANMDK